MDVVRYASKMAATGLGGAPRATDSSSDGFANEPQTTEPTTVEKLRGLPWSIATNAANTIFSQFIYFGSVFVLFLDQIGLSKSEIGFALSLIPFSALVAPFVAPLTARYGYKRTFLIFYGIRKTVSIPLLLTPWVLAAYGERVTFFFIVGVVALFSLSRSIEETAYHPWVQEFVPNSVRGKYSATSNIFTALIGFVSVMVAGFVIGSTDGLTGFMLLFAAGILFGYLSVWASSYIPGGAPRPDSARSRRRDLGDAIRDVDFRSYLAGIALITLGTVPLASFLPLYLQEEIGIATDRVILLQLGTLLGALVSSYVWGWAADRYGSKPVMTVGVWLLFVAPLLWLALPRGVWWGLYVVLGIAFFQGVANLGWAIGAGRLLFVRIVPSAKRLDYMALYFAWIGVVAGASQLVGGRALDLSRNLSSLSVSLDPYAPLFLAALIFPLASLLVFKKVQPDSPFTTRQFAGIFLKGNPFRTAGTLVRFYRTRDERAAVQVTGHIGELRSPMAVEELLDALADPRFNVRFEAILAMGRMRPDPRLTDALVEVLEANNPALSVVAAWALGRLRDPAAVEALQCALDAPYRSVQAHAARALAALGDRTSAPLFLDRLEEERDRGLRVAYAAALGQLGAREAVQPILALLQASEERGERMELALALARLVGDEGNFVQMARRTRSQPGVALAQTVAAVQKRLGRRGQAVPGMMAGLTTAENCFAVDDLEGGAQALSSMVRVLPAGTCGAEATAILSACADSLARTGAARPEYLLLALHTLGSEVGMGSQRVPGSAAMRH